MKITNKLIILLMATLLPIGFVGCSDDDDDKLTPGGEETLPEFVLEQEIIKVKIGADNKVKVEVKEGGGEYSAFVLDTSIAQVEVANNEIILEGFVNGQTSLIISDKYSRYRKVPISVYTTDKLQLSEVDLDLITKLGSSQTTTAEVTLGNGGYEIKSDNPALSVSITEEGEISMTATSKMADYTATVTVTDCTGLSADILVTVKATLVPFTDEELETIMESNTKRYYYNNSSTFYSYYTSLNETLEDGKQRYGWKYYTYYWYYLDFNGGKSLGEKSDANFTYYRSPSNINITVTLKIIKNDGTNIWGIFSYINEDQEKLYTGYFCDTI